MQTNPEKNENQAPPYSQKFWNFKCLHIFLNLYIQLRQIIFFHLHTNNTYNFVIYFT